MNNSLAYGLACLYYLGEHNDGRWNRVEKISKFQGLPENYCARVLRALVCAGFVESRGRGYRLKKDLAAVTVWDLMESFISDPAGAAAAPENRLTIRLYNTLYAQAERLLGSLTVRDIIRAAVNKKRRKKERQACVTHY